jgi:hypothetical protein
MCSGRLARGRVAVAALALLLSACMAPAPPSTGAAPGTAASAPALPPPAVAGSGGAASTPSSPHTTPQAQGGVSAADGLPEVEREAFALLLLGAKDNPVKDCSVAALRLNTGLVMLRMAGAAPAAVADTLRSGIDPAVSGQRELRERQIMAWREGAAPGELARQDFEHCLRVQRVVLELGPAGRSCFSLASVPAQAEGLKGLRRSRERATMEITASYAGQVSEDFVRKVVTQVYARDRMESRLEAHRQVLADCVRAAR